MMNDKHGAMSRASYSGAYFPDWAVTSDEARRPFYDDLVQRAMQRDQMTLEEARKWIRAKYLLPENWW